MDDRDADRARGGSPSIAGLGACLLAGLAALLPLPADATAQVHDEVRVLGRSAGDSQHEALARFTRKLELAGHTDLQPQGGYASDKSLLVDGDGRSWIVGDDRLLRVDAEGSLLGPVLLTHTPWAAALSADGRAFATSFVAQTGGIGPAFGCTPGGSLLWSSFDGPSLFPEFTRQVALTAAGELWLGNFTWDGVQHTPLLARLDPDDGSVLDTLSLAPDGSICALAPAPDGSLWAYACVAGMDRLDRILDGEVVQSIPALSAGPSNYRMQVDGAGRVLYARHEGVPEHGVLLRYDPAAPEAPPDTWLIKHAVGSWALGPTGEEAYLVTHVFSDPPEVRRLARLSLVTGALTEIQPAPAWTSLELAYGDPTGLVHANVIDRLADSDGDGAANGAETAAGYDPFDPLSRPGGPKLYLSFTPDVEALSPILTLVDPDGLLDLQDGLALDSLTITAGGGTKNLLPYLLGYLTEVQLSSDRTTATATFGGLQVSYFFPVAFEARVADLGGAEAWDWQISPSYPDG